jgi:hypothetical protein
MALDFVPETIVQLRERFAAALQVLWIDTGQKPDQGPGDLRRFVFDYRETVSGGHPRLSHYPCVQDVSLRMVVVRIHDQRPTSDCWPDEFVQARFVFSGVVWEPWEQEAHAMDFLRAVSGIEHLPVAAYVQRLNAKDFMLTFRPVPRQMVALYEDCNPGGDNATSC